MPFRLYFIAGAAALLVSTATALAACGGDDSGGSTGTGGGGTGSDESYVAGLCKAMLKFEDSVTKVTDNAKDVKSADDAIKLFTGPLETFVSDVEKLKPPADAKDYNTKSIKAFRDAIDKLKKNKDISALGDATVGDPPKEVGDRLQKVADKNEDCKKASLNFN